MLSEYLMIGQVLKPQGIQGLVKVRPDTDDPGRFEELNCVYLQKDGEYVQIDVSEISVREDAVYLRLDHAQSREDAEKQRNWMLYIDRAHAIELEENENFLCDIIGCKAMDTQGNELGQVTDVMQPGGNDVYVIQTAKGEMLVPALKFVILEVKAAEGIVVIDEKRLPEVAVCDWE